MSDPITAIEEMLDRRGWNRRYLLPAFGGSTGRMSEALSRKRPLSISQIRCLVFNYGMDAETLIKWYPTTRQPDEPVNVYELIREHNEMPERDNG